MHNDFKRLVFLISYKYIFMDLDGTISNSYEGIAKSLIYAHEKMGLVPPNATEMRKYIGPPLRNSYIEYSHFTDEMVERGMELYRERYNTVGLFENYLYPTTKDTLHYIYDKGGILVLATSKPQRAAERVMEYFDIDKYFALQVGSDDQNGIDTKYDVIKKAMEKLKITDKSEVVMVGDRNFDIYGAHEAGIACIGLLTGFGSREEFTEAGAEYIVKDMRGIIPIVL